MISKLKLANFISVTPLIFMVFTLVFYIIGLLKPSLYFIKTTYIITLGLVILLHLVFKKIFVNMFEQAKRPKGAKGCDFFSIGPDVSGKPGFPSGHLSITTFVCIYFILLIIYNPYFKNKNKNIKILLIMANILTILLMGWARHYKKCHNIVQIIGGILLGGSMASLLYFLK